MVLGFIVILYCYCVWFGLYWVCIVFIWFDCIGGYRYLLQFYVDINSKLEYFVFMVNIDIEKLKDCEADVKMAMLMFGHIANKNTLYLELCDKPMSPVEVCAYLNVNTVHYKRIIGMMRKSNMIMLAGSGNFEIIILNPDYCLDLDVTQYIQTLRKDIFAINNIELMLDTKKKPVNIASIVNKSIGRYTKGDKNGKH